MVCSALVFICLASLAVSQRTGRHPVSRLFYRGDRVVERFNDRFGIPGGLVEHLAFIIVGTLLVFAYSGLFGQRFYPVLPEQLGGGQPRPAQLLIAPDAVAALNRLGIPVSADDLLTPPVELLWEREQGYVIRLPDSERRSVIKIDQALVDGVVTGAALAPVATPAAP